MNDLNPSWHPIRVRKSGRPVLWIVGLGLLSWLPVVGAILLVRLLLAG
jgi:hypothetical protein